MHDKTDRRIAIKALPKEGSATAPAYLLEADWTRLGANMVTAESTDTVCGLRRTAFVRIDSCR